MRTCFPGTQQLCANGQLSFVLLIFEWLIAMFPCKQNQYSLLLVSATQSFALILLNGLEQILFTFHWCQYRVTPLTSPWLYQKWWCTWKKLLFFQVPSSYSFFHFEFHPELPAVIKKTPKNKPLFCLLGCSCWKKLISLPVPTQLLN